MKKRLKIISNNPKIGFHFLGLYDPDDTEGISREIYSVLRGIYLESTAKAESLRIANKLREETIYCANYIAFSLYEDIIKYFVEVGTGNYITDLDGRGLSYDYRDAYLFLSKDLDIITSQYKGTELTISEVNKDPNLFNEVCGILESVYCVKVDDDFIKSQKEDYFYELTQKYILHGDTYKGLAITIAACMSQDYWEYEECLELMEKSEPN